MIEKLSLYLGEDSKLYPHQTEAKYPHIVKKISILWGTIGMSRYFNEILFDDRGGRGGFPAEVMTELFSLSNFHESTKPRRGVKESSWPTRENDRLGRFEKKS